MGLSQQDLVRRFAEGKTSGSASNMFIRGDKLYSYGTHFILAIRYGTKKQYYLLNGDRYSSSTSRHQSYCQHGLKPNYIIPFSVLTAALPETRYDHDYRLVFLDDTPEEFREVEYRDPKTNELKTRQEHQLGSTLFRRGKRYFLSSTDPDARWRRGYFLVELPRAVTTIKEAYDSLKPINEDILDGQPCLRQGEFFLIPKPDIQTKDLEPIEKRQKWLYQIIESPCYNPDAYIRANQWHKRYYENNWFRERWSAAWNKSWPTGAQYENNNDAWKELYKRIHVDNDGQLLIGGAVHRVPNPLKGESGDVAKLFESRDHRNPHKATAIRKDKEGNIYIRGTLRHRDHNTIKMGKVWHRVLVNRAKRSWSVSGNVD